MVDDKTMISTDEEYDKIAGIKRIGPGSIK